MFAPCEHFFLFFKECGRKGWVGGSFCDLCNETFEKLSETSRNKTNSFQARVGGGFKSFDLNWCENKTKQSAKKANSFQAMDKPITIHCPEVTKGAQIENANINEKRCPQGMGIRIWTCPWTNRSRWIALKALEVPNWKTQKSMKNDAPQAWKLEYEHVHGQTDSAESRWRH